MYLPATVHDQLLSARVCETLSLVIHDHWHALAYCTQAAMTSSACPTTVPKVFTEIERRTNRLEYNSKVVRSSSTVLEMLDLVSYMIENMPSRYNDTEQN